MAQIYLTLNLRSVTEFILKYFGITGHNILTKFSFASFPKKSFFDTIVQFGLNLGQKYTTLFPRQLCLMIHSLKIVEYGMMGYNSYTKLTINLPKKLLFWARTIWAQFRPNSCNLICYDSSYEHMFEFFWHDNAQ